MSTQAKTASKATPKNQPVRYVYGLCIIMRGLVRLTAFQLVVFVLELEVNAGVCVFGRLYVKGAILGFKRSVFL